MPTPKIGTIREFKTRNFHVVVDAVEEIDLDLSWDEDGQTRKGLENGSLIAFCARARVFLRGNEIASDYLGGCIYKSLEDFADHKECGKQNRETIRREGRFQIYRKARKHEHCLLPTDKLRKRGFATRERAEAWAKGNAKEEYEIFETGKCGSYFADMVSTVCEEARKTLTEQHKVYVRGNAETRKFSQTQEKREWVKWLESYGLDKFFDAFLANTQGAQSTCIHCREKIYLDIVEGGGVPDWKTEDGDYGCADSPETSEQGTGSHMPRKLEE